MSVKKSQPIWEPDALKSTGKHSISGTNHNPIEIMRTCITPEQTFVYGLHKPSYSVRNLRSRTRVEKLGTNADGKPVLNESNYPAGTIEVEQANWRASCKTQIRFVGQMTNLTIKKVVIY